MAQNVRKVPTTHSPANEDNCGGFGDVVLDVRARKLTVERNDRFEDYTTTTYEV
jgi:hypothetical protein